MLRIDGQPSGRFADELPLTATGKVNKHVLAEILELAASAEPA